MDSHNFMKLSCAYFIILFSHGKIYVQLTWEEEWDHGINQILSNVFDTN
jgi:hypothetical protein